MKHATKQEYENKVEQISNLLSDTPLDVNREGIICLIRKLKFHGLIQVSKDEVLQEVKYGWCALSYKKGRMYIVTVTIRKFHGFYINLYHNMIRVNSECEAENLERLFMK